MKRQWYYRGSLKSCNYTCSYCPFAKRKGSVQERQKDQKAFFRFIERFNHLSDAQGALLLTPYGEALIHSYYWEGMAGLSRNPGLEAVGAQSNFSFPVRQQLSVYEEHGGDVRKLRLWGTFHPEMVSAEQFVQQCEILSSQKIAYCVGAVGVPEYIEEIRRLRTALPSLVYLWINKMDGLKRAYTPTECKALLEIDPYFGIELAHYKADASRCGRQRFVEADGTMHRCNLCRQSLGSFYDAADSGIQGEGSCTRKTCSCYLSYCNREGELPSCFLPYPAFRIPQAFDYKCSIKNHAAAKP